mmetsp:Transcript_20466/g.32923  ORF Transcript_20466/g.32923 Transcript_20466/m.32923 type:complete len:88 (+) Transcript_20466:1-264(+)
MPFSEPVLAWAPKSMISSSRRAFVKTTVASTLPLLVTHPGSKAAAIPDSNSKETKEAEKSRKAKEKEARRLAEETKKRLAVGRIGAF